MQKIIGLDYRVRTYRNFSDTEMVMSVAKLNEKFAVFTGAR